MAQCTRSGGAMDAGSNPAGRRWLERLGRVQNNRARALQLCTNPPPPGRSEWHHRLSPGSHDPGRGGHNPGGVPSPRGTRITDTTLARESGTPVDSSEGRRCDQVRSLGPGRTDPLEMLESIPETARGRDGLWGASGGGHWCGEPASKPYPGGDGLAGKSQPGYGCRNSRSGTRCGVTGARPSKGADAGSIPASARTHEAGH